MRLLLLLTIVSVVQATQEVAHQAGQQFTTHLQQQATQRVPQETDVPGFSTSQPPQANLSLNGDWSGAISLTLNQSDAGQALQKSAETRTRFKLDPVTDPLFKQDLSAINITTTTEDEISGKEIICEEGGDDLTYECNEDRVVVPQVPTKQVTVTVNHLNFIPYMVQYNVWVGGGFWKHGHNETRTRQSGYYVTLPKNIATFKALFCPNFPQTLALNLDCQRIQSYVVKSGSQSVGTDTVTVYVPSTQLTLELSHDTYEGEGIDEWGNGCASLEQMVEAGLCHYGERVCTQGEGIRSINGYQIKKDAWQYRQKYHCKMIKDECSALKAQGCYQVRSRCKEERQGRCWIFEQTYQCNDLAKRKIVAQDPSQLFCFTGQCHDMSYTTNNEMLEAISKLAVLKEVQDDLREQQNSSSFSIFKGGAQKCSRNCINFKDCCGGMKGWGVDFHLAGCKAEEKQLAVQRGKNLCHLLGTYCSKRVLGKCVSKKTSFCCFGNKFARVVQEQGRAQLGLNWGDVKVPDCRGLTVEELAKIDFSRLDLREVFSDIMQKYKAPNLPNLTTKTQSKIQENLSQIEQNLQEKSGNINAQQAAL